MSKSFEKLTKELNAKKFYWHSITQIENRKKFSVTVAHPSSWNKGYGVDKDLEKATKKALADYRSSMTEKDWKAVRNDGIKPRKKRVKLRPSRRIK